jgi:hypothetical protein
MRVRLKARWGSRMQGDIVNVSDARALALEEAGLARIIDAPVIPEPEPEPIKDEESEAAELEAVKSELDALGISYHPRIGLDKAKAKLDEAKSTN